MKTVIIDYGAGNVQSVKFALRRLGVEAILSNKQEEIIGADYVIFPGVGEALSAMNALRKFNLDKLIPELKQPVMGICLGLQLMCDFSSERDTDCLGIFSGISVKRFVKRDNHKVPHMGWNRINGQKHFLFEDLEEAPFCYFVHSYYAPLNKYTVASTEYIEEFSAVMAKDNFYACQFHPEKSAEVGSKILQNFLTKSK
jgi:glutamine amidotransferase